MGHQQVLRAVAAVLLIGGVAAAAPKERVAIVDLGPTDDGARQKLAAAAVAGGLDPLIGDGVEDALAGIHTDADSLALAAAMVEAKDRFGALACKEATTAAQTAIAIGAARQAAGRAVPELPRAWAYVLLCADRTRDTAAAIVAATHIRTLGGTPEVDAQLLAKYPEVDALSNRDVIEIEIQTDAGADVFVDFKRVGKAPLKLVLPTGPHIMAAAIGSRRGVVTGTVIRKQPVVTIPVQDQAGRWSSLASRIASWHGKVPKAKELAWVLREVDARVLLVRHGDTVEAWGHAGQGEPVRRLGNDDGIRKLDETAALVALVVDRAQTWSDRAPDPDQPLLVETREERRQRGLLRDEEEEPARWWVYAAIAGAVVGGALIIYAHDSAQDMQRVELKWP
jgi:hypothetical protein